MWPPWHHTYYFFFETRKKHIVSVDKSKVNNENRETPKTCKYISKKKDTAEEISNPLTIILIKFIFFLLAKTNWEMEKNKDNQSDKFPKYDVIY